jgi:pimeloyl-ACP methyl ester carboxylesterase
MPYAVNQGTRIHYEVEGQGIPLVLQYGQYFPLDVWYELNYVAALKPDFRLILIDARGHGDSDKPHDPQAYRIEPMVKDILAVLDDLGLQKVNYMGYSSGASLGFGIAKFAPERLSSLILGGNHPYDQGEERFKRNEEQANALQKQTTEDFVADLEAFILSLNLPPFSPHMRTRMLTHDTQALSAWRRQFPYWTSFEDILSRTTIPCLLYAGENDDCYTEAQTANKELPDAVFVSIPNGGHLEGGTWIDILQPHIKTLLNKVTA